MGTPKQLLKSLHINFMALWHTIVISKNGGVCVACPVDATEAHHVCSRGSSSFIAKYDPDNGVPLCNCCHKKLHDTHDDDVWGSILEYLESVGIDYEELSFRSRQAAKISFESIEEIERKLIEAGQI